MKNCSASGGLTPHISLPPLNLIPIYDPGGYCKNELFKVGDKTYTLGNLHPQHWEENEKSIIVVFI